VYQITCTGAGGVATSSATLTVNVKPAPPPPADTGSSKGGGGAMSIETLLALWLLLGLRHVRVEAARADAGVKTDSPGASRTRT
jgi:hypothetical protein